MTFGLAWMLPSQSISSIGEPMSQVSRPSGSGSTVCGMVRTGKLTKLLVGKWVEEVNEPPKVTGQVTTQYRDNNTYAGEAALTVDGKAVTVSVTGTWKVENGTLVEVVEKSSGGVPKGATSRDKFVAASKEEVKLTSEKGRTILLRRVPD